MRPMKEREAGSAHDMLARAMVEAGARVGGDGVAAAADFVGVSKFTLYKQMDPDNSAEFSVARLALLARHWQLETPAEFFATLAGGAYLPGVAAGDPRFSDLTGAALAHLGEASREIIEAHSPRSEGGATLTPAEARRLLTPLMALLHDVSNLVALTRAVADGEVTP